MKHQVIRFHGAMNPKRRYFIPLRAPWWVRVIRVFYPKF